MASSPLRAPPAAGGSQQQSRLLEMQKKFQQKHLAGMTAVKGVTGLTATSNPSPPSHPVPPVRKFGPGATKPMGATKLSSPMHAIKSPTVSNGFASQQSKGPSSLQRRGTTTDTSEQILLADLNVKGKQPQRNGVGARRNVQVQKIGGTGTAASSTSSNSDSSAIAAVPKLQQGGGNATRKVLLPPVVQPTVTNPTGASRLPGKLPAAVSPPKRTSPAIKVSAMPARKQVAAKPKPPPATLRKKQPSTNTSLQKQLSADRGPPAPGNSRCPHCARDFATDRLEKHKAVCQRTRARRTKVFDASKKRLEAVAAEAGVDVASFKKKSQQEDKRAEEKLQKKKDAWRRKHEQLVKNVRAARAVQRHLAGGGNIRDLPEELQQPDDPDPDADSDLTKCPHCGRTFNDAAAERHIPLCAERQRAAAARQANKRK